MTATRSRTSPVPTSWSRSPGSRSTVTGSAARGARTRSGVATFVVHDEDEALVAASALLSYLPSNHLDDPPFVLPRRPGRPRLRGRRAGCPGARDRVLRRAHVSSATCSTRDSFLELRPSYAPNMVTGLARLDGRPVGIVANQPMHNAGTLDIDASQKAARFVQWCDCFNIPCSPSSTPAASSPAATSSGAG